MTQPRSVRVLYITWDGPQVSYLEGLFLPIFAALRDEHIRFHVLQFTWGSDKEELSRRQEMCEQLGVEYKSLRVWRYPRAAGALLTALTGGRRIRRIMKATAADVVLSRSTLPALATLLALRKVKNVPLIFDADGFPQDERVDFSGQSASSLIYRIMRDVEAQAIRRADRVLARTYKAVEILKARGGAGVSTSKFHVVINGRDPTVFRLAGPMARQDIRTLLGIGDTVPLIVYAGSMGDQYLPDKMLKLFGLILRRRPEAHFLVLTGAPDAFSVMLNMSAVSANSVTVMKISAAEVPAYLASADLGIALRQPSFSMQGVAPVKLGEYLLCGLPVVATLDVGDADKLRSECVHLLADTEPETLQMSADWFVDFVLLEREKLGNKARVLGLQHYALERSVADYRDALWSLNAVQNKLS